MDQQNAWVIISAITIKSVMEVMKNKQEQQQEMQQNKNIIHTDCNRIERERDERKNAQTDLRGSPWVRLRPWEGKTKSFLLWSQYTSGSFSYMENTVHPCLI